MASKQNYGSGYTDETLRRKALLGALNPGEPPPGTFHPAPPEELTAAGPPNGGALPPSAPPRDLNPSPHAPGINDWPPNTPPSIAGPDPAGRVPFPAQTPAPAPAPAGGGWDANRVSQYFASKGVQPFPTSVDYWVQKWNEWGKNDPAYFEQRLAQADEFTGKGPNYNWQAAGQPDPGTKAGPGGAINPGGSVPGAGPAYPPELAQFYAAQTEAIRRQQERDAQVQATMRDALLKLMNKGQEPVDLTNDPGAAAFRNAQWREQRKGRDALAERAAFLGLNSGGQGSGSFETSLQGQQQDTQNAIADYEARRTTDELQNRRQMLVQGLQIAQALGARTEASSLQRELAMIDAQLRQAQLGFQYAGLNQNQSQFEDTLGLSYNQLLSSLNRNSYFDLMNQRG